MRSCEELFSVAIMPLVALSYLAFAMVPLAPLSPPGEDQAWAGEAWASGARASDAPTHAPVSHAFQGVIEQRITIRVPARPGALTSFSASEQVTVTGRMAPVTWKEVKGPRCIAVRAMWSVVGARKDSIDILTRERQMLRAKLTRGCRSLDFYSGFYMRDTPDSLLCADRDRIQARSGVECEIDGFRRLVPHKDRKEK